MNKERQLAGLQLEEKEQEAELWRKKYLRLQVNSFVVTAHDIIPEKKPVGNAPCIDYSYIVALP